MGHRVFLLSLPLLLLIVSTTRHAQAAAAVTQGMVAGVGSNGNSNSMMMRSMVGSRPPSCAGRCWWCGGRRCVAVQVPITPQDNKKVHGRGAGGAGASAAALHKKKKHQQKHHQQQQVSSYDDHSNYKPLSWRCKCGGGINP
ncbi:unnamed protein product [Urochloa humidicola]